jgi:hypothetical protein
VPNFDKTTVSKKFSKFFQKFKINYVILIQKRDINEKYVFSFAEKMHKKISENYLSLSSLDHKIFDSIQYDILRRIRAYWVPRFILNKLKQLKKDYGAFPLPPLTPEYSRQSTYISVPSTGKSISYGSREDKNEELNADQKSYVIKFLISIINYI